MQRVGLTDHVRHRTAGHRARRADRTPRPVGRPRRLRRHRGPSVPAGAGAGAVRGLARRRHRRASSPPLGRGDGRGGRPGQRRRRTGCPRRRLGDRSPGCCSGSPPCSRTACPGWACPSCASTSPAGARRSTCSPASAALIPLATAQAMGFAWVDGLIAARADFGAADRAAPLGALVERDQPRRAAAGRRAGARTPACARLRNTPGWPFLVGAGAAVHLLGRSPGWPAAGSRHAWLTVLPLAHRRRGGAPAAGRPTDPVAAAARGRGRGGRRRDRVRAGTDQMKQS